MSAQPASIATTIRGKAALDEVRDLLDLLAKVDTDLDACDAYAIDCPVVGGVQCASWQTISGIYVNHDELHAVIQRRRDVILNKLQNKGIRIAPDPEQPTHAPPLERVPADVGPTAD